MLAGAKPFAAVVLDRKVISLPKEQPTVASNTIVYIQIKREDGSVEMIYDMSATFVQIEATNRLNIGQTYWFPKALQ